MYDNMSPKTFRNLLEEGRISVKGLVQKCMISPPSQKAFYNLFSKCQTYVHIYLEKKRRSFKGDISYNEWVILETNKSLSKFITMLFGTKNARGNTSPPNKSLGCNSFFFWYFLDVIEVKPIPFIDPDILKGYDILILFGLDKMASLGITQYSISPNIWRMEKYKVNVSNPLDYMSFLLNILTGV